MFPSAVLICLALVVVLVGAAGVVPETRIVNGRQIGIEDAPWQVVLYFNETNRCGGSIISTRWALSAAHCVVTKEYQLYTIRIGSAHKLQGGTVYQVEAVVKHKKYIRGVKADISVLKTKEEMVLVLPVRPVRLPEPGSPRLPVNTSVTVTGWGLTENGTYPDLLRAVDIVITDYKHCEAIGAESPKFEICAGLPGRNAFSGDSGGPLVRGDLQVGVVSWGTNETGAQYPALYTDVAYYRKWIKKHTGV